MSIQDIKGKTLKVYVVGTYISLQHIHCIQDIGVQDIEVQLYHCILSIHVHITITSFALNCMVYSLKSLDFDSLPFAFIILIPS